MLRLHRDLGANLIGSAIILELVRAGRAPPVGADPPEEVPMRSELTVRARAILGLAFLGLASGVAADKPHHRRRCDTAKASSTDSSPCARSRARPSPRRPDPARRGRPSDEPAGLHVQGRLPSRRDHRLHPEGITSVCQLPARAEGPRPSSARWKSRSTRAMAGDGAPTRRRGRRSESERSRSRGISPNGLVPCSSRTSGPRHRPRCLLLAATPKPRLVKLRRHLGGGGVLLLRGLHAKGPALRREGRPGRRDRRSSRRSLASNHPTPTSGS